MIFFFKKIIHSVSEKRGLLFTFLRAQLSSQVSSITDFTVTIILSNPLGGFMRALFGDYYYGYATAIGAVCGGIVNGTINYKWTFKADGQKISHVVVKYIMVWLGSIALNTYGTVLLTEMVKEFEFMQDLFGHHLDNVFIISKIIVSLLVGFLWNFNMQRIFVYRPFYFGDILKKKSAKEDSEEDSTEEMDINDKKENYLSNK